MSLQQEWSRKIQSWENSGIGARQWCSEQKIIYSTFMYWRRKFFAKENNDTLTAKQFFIEVPEEPKRSEILLEINGVSIRIDRNFDKEVLQKCLAILKRLS